MRIVFLLLTLLFISHLNSQIIDYNTLVVKDGLRYYENSLFTGKSVRVKNDSTKMSFTFKNGLIDGDSAVVAYYRNGLIKSVSNFEEGKRLFVHKPKYCMIQATVSGKYNMIVERQWLASQDSLSIRLIPLTEDKINKIPFELITTDSIVDSYNCKIISFDFTPQWCAGGVDAQYYSNSNKILERMRNCVTKYNSKNFFFTSIVCMYDGKTIMLPEVRFKVK